ncbi:MAG: Type 1 phosphatases regulator ypi1 [Chaenotheca gracillima]|nr:MAG: Type 1 phosphatases regulator ypi1 [Chaenotheca gracillima]
MCLQPSYSSFNFQMLPLELQLMAAGHFSAPDLWNFRNACRRNKHFFDSHGNIFFRCMIRNRYLRESEAWPTPDSVVPDFPESTREPAASAWLHYRYSSLWHMELLQGRAERLKRLCRILVDEMSVQDDDIYGKLISLFPFLEVNARFDYNEAVKAQEAFRYLMTLSQETRKNLDVFVTQVCQAWARYCHGRFPAQWRELRRVWIRDSRLTCAELLDSNIAACWLKQQLLTSSCQRLEKLLLLTSISDATSDKWTEDEHGGCSFYTVKVNDRNEQQVFFGLDDSEQGQGNIYLLDRAEQWEMCLAHEEGSEEEFDAVTVSNDVSFYHENHGWVSKISTREQPGAESKCNCTFPA